MADTKVSAFTAASALDGTEVVGGVQSGANAKITIDQIKTYCRTRMDAFMVGASVNSVGSCNAGQSNHIIYVSAGTWYYVYIDPALDVQFTKTTNYGVTWSDPTVIRAASCVAVAVWFDKWTPGDSGTLIHTVYIDSTVDGVYYRSIDTGSSDALGTERTVSGLTSAAISGADFALSVTKSEAGRILVAYDSDGGQETGFFKSNDFPVTGFTSKSNLNESSNTDYYHLFPGNETDTADIYALFWDRSAGELTLKTYDDSLDSWGESAAIASSLTSIASSTVAPQFAGAVRGTDGHLLAVWWTDSDVATADLYFVDITNAGSIGTPVKIFDSSDDQGGCAIGINTTNDHLYVFYLGKTDGTETAYTALTVNYRISTDAGATWGAEVTLSSTRALSYITCSLEFASGEFVVAYGGVDAGALSMLNSAWS